MLKDKTTSPGSLKSSVDGAGKTVIRTEREVFTIDVLQQLHSNLQMLEEFNDRLQFMLVEVSTLTQRFNPTQKS